MQKLLCPYCDHEIKGKGKCDFCGSRVKKPVVVEEASSEFQTQASVIPNESDYSAYVPEAQTHDDTYPDGGALSRQADGGMAGAPDSAQDAAGSAAAASQTGAASPLRAGTAGIPRRAVLASEALELGKAAGTMKPAGANSQKVAKTVAIIAVIYVIVQFVLYFLSSL